MRPSNKSRSRNNKPGNSGNGNHNNNNQRRNNLGNIINRVFESAGPDGKVRGTPQQIIDKYQALARDAQVAGDRVAAESYLQHSEHYSRLLGEAQRQQMENRSFQQEREDGQRGEDGGFDQQRRPQPAMAQPVASGLTMIDPDDSYDMGGPIETPEGRRPPRDEPAPVVDTVIVAAPPMNGGQPAPQETADARSGDDAAEPAQAGPKRSRRRPRTEAPAPVAQVE